MTSSNATSEQGVNIDRLTFRKVRDPADKSGKTFKWEGVPKGYEDIAGEGTIVGGTTIADPNVNADDVYREAGQTQTSRKTGGSKN